MITESVVVLSLLIHTTIKRKSPLLSINLLLVVHLFLDYSYINIKENVYISLTLLLIGSELPAHRVGTFRNFFRMAVSEFDYLLSSIERDIEKAPTSVNPITAKERLMVTPCNLKQYNILLTILTTPTTNH